MKLTIDIERDTIIKNISFFVYNLITFSYRWLTTDGEVLGYILATIHIILSIIIVICLIISHTLYPVFWFQCFVFFWMFLVWFQHIFLKVCVLIVAERELTTTSSPYYELMNEFLSKFFNIDIDDFIKYFILTETVAVACFGLEIVSNISSYFQRIR
jgi:hypothetical protein